MTGERIWVPSIEGGQYQLDEGCHHSLGRLCDLNASPTPRAPPLRTSCLRPRLMNKPRLLSGGASGKGVPLLLLRRRMGSLGDSPGTSRKIAVSRLWRVPPRFFRSLPLDRPLGVVPAQWPSMVPPPRLGLGRLGRSAEVPPFSCREMRGLAVICLRCKSPLLVESESWRLSQGSNMYLRLSSKCFLSGALSKRLNTSTTI